MQLRNRRRAARHTKRIINKANDPRTTKVIQNSKRPNPQENRISEAASETSTSDIRAAHRMQAMHACA